MATYFHGNTEIQAPDGLQTLLLMNPTAYVQYSDTPPPPPPPTSANHFVFLNSAANSLSTHNHLPHHHAPISSHTQQFVGIPLPTSAAPNHHDLPNITSMHSFINPAHLQYNLWNPNINNEPSTVARDSPRSQQGLSLSLSSSQHPLPPLGYGSIRDQRKGSLTQSAQQAISNDHDMRNISGGSSSSASGITNGVSGLQGVLLSTKYLKAAQDLLDEVVNVGNDHNGIKKGSNIGQQSKEVGEGSGRVAGDGSAGMLADGKNSSELSTAERQEIQMKKAKLIGMLDEVEQRYRQYHHQMHIIISSFEQAAGIGSAKTYTALALETISRQFRCLKDTITSQIKTANKTLGEEDNGLSNGGGKIEGSRLKYVDHQLRQQRALQQLGMIQHNAWRPQRGLPERSVSVLRAWLFEHFLHPYPKDSDKTMLAKQTGLTRSQVSNWFINARVRLWKPMVEEMYLEEIKEQEQSNTNIGGVVKSNNEGSPSKSITSQGKSTSTPPTHDHQNQLSSFNSKQENPPEILTPPKNLQNQSGFSLIGSSELEGITQSSPKKQRNSDHVEATNEHNMSMKFNENHRQSSRDEFSFMGGQTNFIGGFGQYPIGEIDTRFNGDDQFAPRFTGNNGVSLTLGLPHCENLSLSEAHQGFLQNQSIRINGTRRVVDNIGEQDEFSAMNGTNGSSVSHSSTAFENINIQNRKRFAAQLLHDFVA